MTYFQGYRRPDGQGGVRNHVLVIPSVGCSQGAARAIARSIKGAAYLPNILGCGQVGQDRVILKRTLVGFGASPNVFGVLIVGNGCEQLAPEEIGDAISPFGKPVEIITIQNEGGTRKTVSKGKAILREMAEAAARQSREPIPLSELVLGTECGGSDYTSGLASNPAVGIACDLLIAEGGTVMLSETPELIGAEHLLARRAGTPETARRILDAVAWWEREALAAGQDIREVNPSPGNMEGGITTLEEKSLGCIYKAGSGTVREAIEYASRPTKKGLIYMDTPAHDIEQLTGMVAGGAQAVVFTTGRGTPCGSPIAPVVKVTANRRTFMAMRDNMDIDVSAILRGTKSVEEEGRRIFDGIIAAASGKITKAERWGQRDFAIFKRYANI